jgi:hypothetical protein
MSKSTSNVVLTVGEWNTSGIRYMQPKVNDRGAKSINIISTQTNRSLHISTPLMMTWGISDFVDEKGESDGKFSMSLNFPNSDYSNASTDQFLQKLKEFENQILNDAVKYSESWFGEEMSLAVAKHTFFPFLKYTKDKMTKKFDYTKPPSIRGKVPNYNNKWAIEIYDTKGTMIFPCDNENLTPMDFVPKKSNVACVLQCGGLWFGGKGWGITWKINQIVVKPQEVVSVYGRCHIQLSNDDIQTIETQEPVSNNVEEDEEVVVSVPASVVPSTVVEDSDDEGGEPATVAPTATPLPEVVVPESIEEPVVVSAPPPVVKKIVKKAAAPAVEPEVSTETETVVKKKIIKKKV